MLHLWLLLLILNAVSSQYTVKVESNKRDLKEGEDLLLTWTVVEDDGWVIQTRLQLRIDNNIIAEATIDGLNTVTKIEEYFGKRVTIDNSNNDNLKYVMKISNLNVTDSYTIEGKILSKKLAGAEQYKGASAEITLDVNADPKFYIALPIKIDIKEKEKTQIKSVVYGKPEPVSVLKFNGEDVSLLSSKQEPNHTYTYIHELRELSAKDCGGKLMHEVTGNSQTIKANSTVTVLFTPTTPPTFTAPTQSMEKIVQVQWNSVESGECEALMQYIIKMTNATGHEVLSRNLSQTQYNFNNTLLNATSLRIYAVFMDTYISKPTAEIGIPPPATTTTTTTTTTTSTTTKAPATTKIKEVDPGERTNGESSDPGMIIGIVVGAIVFLLIIVVIVLFILKRKKEEKPVNPTERGDENTMGMERLPTKDEGIYSNSKEMQPRPHHPQDPDQMIYAQLGPGGGRTGPRPDNNMSDYAEIKVDEMGYPARGPSAGYEDDDAITV